MYWPGQMTTKNPSQNGFSLLEVLVALVIVSIALTALTRQFSSQANFFEQSRDRMLAHWVAQNQLAAMQAYQGAKAWPDPGGFTSADDMAGRVWVVNKSITNTPNETIRQVEVGVASEHGNSLARLVGFIVKPVQK